VDNVSKLVYLGFGSFEKAISSVDNDHHAAFSGLAMSDPLTFSSILGVDPLLRGTSFFEL
jgi:hypothetical protein